MDLQSLCVSVCAYRAHGHKHAHTVYRHVLKSTLLSQRNCHSTLSLDNRLIPHMFLISRIKGMNLKTKFTVNAWYNTHKTTHTMHAAQAYISDKVHLLSPHI